MLASAPPTRNGEMIQRAFAEGWAGAVTKTITVKGTISPKPRLATAIGPARNYFLENIELLSEYKLEQWCKWLAMLDKNFPEPVIASIMASGKKPEEWGELAKAVCEAGAKGVELNVSCPHGLPEKGAGAFIGQDPGLTAEVTSAVREAIKAPIWVKLTPNVTDIVAIGRSAVKSGADALAGINTLSGIAGVDIDNFTPLPAVANFSTSGGISGPGIKPVALRCISELAVLKIPLSGMGGISDWREAVEFMLLGAGTVQICTAVMFHGYGIIEGLVSGLEGYLERKGFSTVGEIIGKSLSRLTDFSNLPVEARVRFEVGPECDLCGDCVIACRDGGYQAMTLGKSRARINQKKCSQCGLCQVVCPVGAIKIGQ